MPTEPDTTARLEISELLVRYATGIDRRDWALFRTCFTDDCAADYGRIGRWASGDEITAFMEAAHRDLGYTMHRMTNIAIDGDGDSDRARARCYSDTVLLPPDKSSLTKACGFFDDELVRDGGSWRIARRTFTEVLTQVRLPLDQHVS